MSLATTLQLSSMNGFTVSAPMFPAAPVISTVFPAKPFSTMTLLTASRRPAPVVHLPLGLSHPDRRSDGGAAATFVRFGRRPDSWIRAGDQRRGSSVRARSHLAHRQRRMPVTRRQGEDALRDFGSWRPIRCATTSGSRQGASRSWHRIRSTRCSAPTSPQANRLPCASERSAERDALDNAVDADRLSGSAVRIRRAGRGDHRR